MQISNLTNEIKEKKKSKGGQNEERSSIQRVPQNMEQTLNFFNILASTNQDQKCWGMNFGHGGKSFANQNPLSRLHSIYWIDYLKAAS